MDSKNFHDEMAKLCLSHFELLPKTGKPKLTEWTILSCIIQEKDAKFDVIALGTGSKCLGHNAMSARGDILNDSHAEVICRRAFLRYIYHSMLDNNSDILLFNVETNRFSLQKNVKFHFFTTHVPCGDAAIFPKQNQQDFGNALEQIDQKVEIMPPSKRPKTDIFRTGAKCLPAALNQDLHLEGSEFHITGVVRTKPGRGVSTLSVSCSDKIAKWVNLGLQGALLSFLLENPIYLSSFTIVGHTAFNMNALNRALFDRLKKPLKQSKLEIGQANLHKFKYQKSDEMFPSAASIAWMKGNSDKTLEVAIEGKRQGVTKKQLKSPTGRLKICKMELFKLFIQILKDREITLENIEHWGDLRYESAKKLDPNYCQSWTELKEQFGCWTNKHQALLQFTFDTN